MSGYDGTMIAKVVARLERRAEPPLLVPPAEWDAELTAALQSTALEELFGGRPIGDGTAAEAVRAGLLLWNDALDASHKVSQGIDTPLGSYWHGIMHRREPDYGNARYWFQKVGKHAAMPRVREAVLAAGAPGAGAPAVRRLCTAIEAQAAWDAERFVDWCEGAHASGAGDPVATFLRAAQLEEMRVLLAFSFAQATG